MNNFSKNFLVILAFIHIVVACYYQDAGDILDALFYVGLGIFTLLLVQVEKK